MNNEQSGTQNPAEETTATRGKPTRRGARGRGNRGNPNPRPPKQRPQAQLPTLAERAAQVAGSSATPVTTLPVQPVPLQQLSAIMDAHFPVEMSPTSYVNYITLDTDGYMDVAISVYRQLMMLDPKLGAHMSMSEFCLAAGWILAYRGLEVQMSIAPDIIAGWLDLKEAMNSLPSIPEPLVHYLEGVGLYRDAYGHTLCPRHVLPSFNVQNVTVGMVPCELTDRVTPNFTLGGAMFPYGLLERQILVQGNPNVANAGTQLTQLDPAVPGARDASLGRVGTYPIVSTFPPHRDRIAFLANIIIARNQPQLLNSIRWHTPLFSDFCSFCKKIAKLYSCVPYPVSKAGSPAMTSHTMAVAPNPGRKNENYMVFGFMALTNSEQHAARLFRYRRARIDNNDGYVDNDAGRNLTVFSAPLGLNGNPPLELTEVRIHTIYLDHYTQYFAHKT